MCLVALAIDESRRFPLVVVANRDEFFSRPAARLAWWSAEADGPAILGGRDLDGGGTWMGLTAQGRLALVTNVREPGKHDPQAPSRGRIVPDWLAARENVDRFWMRTALSGFNGFNLIAADFAAGECFWASNTGAHPQRLERGVHGLSNAALDTPWPKVKALKARLGEAIATGESVEQLASQLFDALGDRSVPSDHTLPDTGIGIARERELSPAFIRTPDLRYGTRCSTLVITERVNRHNVTHVLERSFSPHGGVALLRRATLNHWPPRYNASAVQASAVSEGEFDAGMGGTPATKRTRVRSLLKPEPRRRRAPAGVA
jgi:uncharacterized protein with NRDE domain